MLAPVGGVSSASPVNPEPFNMGTPVANVDAQQLQLERQLQTYNQQLEIARNAARQAEQLQRQIAAVQQQIDQRQVDNARASDRQESNAADDAAAEQLRTNNLLADRQAEDIKADNLAADRLADERLAADRLAADQLFDAQNPIVEPQLRQPTIDFSNLNAPTQAPEPQTTNEDLIPPLAPDDSGRLINTLV